MHLLFDLRRIDGFLLGLFCYHKLNISCNERTRWKKINSDSTDPILDSLFLENLYRWLCANILLLWQLYCSQWLREREMSRAKCTLSTADKSFLCNLFSVINYNVAECDLSSTAAKRTEATASSDSAKNNLLSSDVKIDRILTFDLNIIRGSALALDHNVRFPLA